MINDTIMASFSESQVSLIAVRLMDRLSECRGIRLENIDWLGTFYNPCSHVCQANFYTQCHAALAAAFLVTEIWNERRILLLEGVKCMRIVLNVINHSAHFQISHLWDEQTCDEDGTGLFLTPPSKAHGRRWNSMKITTFYVNLRLSPCKQVWFMLTAYFWLATNHTWVGEIWCPV